MERNLSSLREDHYKLTSEIQDKQTTLTSLTEEMEALKAKHERVSLQVCHIIMVDMCTNMHVIGHIHACHA